MNMQTIRLNLWQHLGGIVGPLLLVGCLLLPAVSPASAAEHVSDVTADQALKRLIEGNKHFVAQTAKNPRRDEARLREVKGAQYPIAVILSCSDSRVSPELIFDQGVGDLFVIRVAGNVADDVVIGSMEYAVEHLGVPLVMVLGHENCGAVKAAMSGSETGDHIESILRAIAPVVEEAKKSPGDQLDACVRLNVERVVKELTACKPILAESVRKSKLRIVGAYYDLHTGGVSLLPEAKH
jgi:carbonic anhydrase